MGLFKKAEPEHFDRIEPKLNLDTGPEDVSGFQFVRDEAANDGPTAKDDMDAMNEAAAKRKAQQEKLKKNPSSPENQACLAAIARLYGCEQLILTSALHDLTLDQSTPATEQSLTVRSSLNTMVITKNGVNYADPLTNISSALQGAVLMRNNPMSQTHAATISGDLRERLLLTLAAEKIGLKVKNPVDLEKDLTPELRAELPQILKELNAHFEKPSAAPEAPQAKQEAAQDTAPAAEPAAAPEAPAEAEETKVEAKAEAAENTNATTDATIVDDIPAQENERPPTHKDGAVDVDFREASRPVATTPGTAAPSIETIIKNAAEALKDIKLKGAGPRPAADDPKIPVLTEVVNAQAQQCADITTKRPIRVFPLLKHNPKKPNGYDILCP